jgi:hypothetical protein
VCSVETGDDRSVHVAKLLRGMPGCDVTVLCWPGRAVTRGKKMGHWPEDLVLFPGYTGRNEQRSVQNTLITNKCTKSFFINCKYTLLHVSTLLDHLQGETLRCRYTRLHYTAERECAAHSQQHILAQLYSAT